MDDQGRGCEDYGESNRGRTVDHAVDEDVPRAERERAEVLDVARLDGLPAARAGAEQEGAERDAHDREDVVWRVRGLGLVAPEALREVVSECTVGTRVGATVGRG